MVHLKALTINGKPPHILLYELSIFWNKTAIIAACYTKTHQLVSWRSRIVAGLRLRARAHYSFRSMQSLLSNIPRLQQSHICFTSLFDHSNRWCSLHGCLGEAQIFQLSIREALTAKILYLSLLCLDHLDRNIQKQKHELKSMVSKVHV